MLNSATGTTEALHEDPVAARIGQALVRGKHISLNQLQTALTTQPVHQLRPGWQFVSGRIIDEDLWAEQVANLFGLASARLEDFTIDRALVEQLPEQLARREFIFPLTSTGSEVLVAVCDPRALSLFDHLRSRFRLPVQPIVVPPSELEHYLRRYYLDEDISGIEHVEAGATQSLTEAELARLRDGGDSNQIVELVDRLMAHAISIHASDIHIEPFKHRLVVRFRVDGVLREGPSYPAALAPWVVSRIKVLAQLDIAERFVPQDGRVRLRKDGREIDQRISTVPVIHGEKVVIRLLGTNNAAPSLERLGFGDDLAVLRRELSRPQGMVLVTGPTGSGKSTTVYAAIHEIACMEVNVVTVEDPVEYEVRGLNQIPINPKRGITFARALRAILRQDPDVILVGEIRDQETGIIAAEASMTGHMLLSTLHTNSAAAAIGRLVEMGVPRHMIAPSLSAVVAQRLMRNVCECAEPYQAEPQEIADLLPDLPHAVTLMKATGCGACENTGYRGRAMIHELIVVDEEIRGLISNAGTTVDIAAAAARKGAKSLATAALERVFKGETTLQELHRVVGG